MIVSKRWSPFSNINEIDLKIYPWNSWQQAAVSFATHAAENLPSACWQPAVAWQSDICLCCRPAVGSIACWRILGSKCCKSITGSLLASHSIVWPFLLVRASGHPILAQCGKISHLNTLTARAPDYIWIGWWHTSYHNTCWKYLNKQPTFNFTIFWHLTRYRG